MYKRILVLTNIYLVMLCGQSFGGIFTTIQDYKPATPEESATKEVLVKYIECYNKKDIKGVGETLADDAVLIVGRDKMKKSKVEYLEYIQKKGMSKIKFTSPKFSQKDGGVFVKLYNNFKGRSLSMTFEMKKISENWLITGWKY